MGVGLTGIRKPMSPRRKGERNPNTLKGPKVDLGKIVFGEWAICPKCHAKVVVVQCLKCDGKGIVPNKGPIPFTQNPGG